MNDSILESLQRISELKQDFYFDFPIDNCELGNWTWTFIVSHHLSVILFAIAFVEIILKLMEPLFGSQHMI